MATDQTKRSFSGGARHLGVFVLGALVGASGTLLASDSHQIAWLVQHSEQVSKLLSALASLLGTVMWPVLAFVVAWKVLPMLVTVLQSAGKRAFSIEIAGWKIKMARMGKALATVTSEVGKLPPPPADSAVARALQQATKLQSEVENDLGKMQIDALLGPASGPALIRELASTIAEQGLTRGGVQAMLSATESGFELPPEQVAPAIRALLIVMESLPPDADQ